MKITNLRPTPGVLIGAIALVFAMSGAAVAAQTIQTNDIAKEAVTGSRIAKDAVKTGKILDGKVKAKDLAPGVVPEVPQMAYGRVNKAGGNVAAAAGAVGITGVASGGPGRDLLRPGVRADVGQRHRGPRTPTSTRARRSSWRSRRRPAATAPYTDAAVDHHEGVDRPAPPDDARRVRPVRRRATRLCGRQLGPPPAAAVAARRISDGRSWTRTTDLVLIRDAL